MSRIYGRVESDYDFIRDNWEEKTDDELSRHLGRGFDSIRKMRSEMGLVRPTTKKGKQSWYGNTALQNGIKYCYSQRMSARETAEWLARNKNIKLTRNAVIGHRDRHREEIEQSLKNGPILPEKKVKVVIPDPPKPVPKIVKPPSNGMCAQCHRGTCQPGRHYCATCITANHVVRQEATA